MAFWTLRVSGAASYQYTRYNVMPFKSTCERTLVRNALTSSMSSVCSGDPSFRFRKPASTRMAYFSEMAGPRVGYEPTYMTPSDRHPFSVSGKLYPLSVAVNSFICDLTSYVF
jgi:hypothetical protein